MDKIEFLDLNLNNFNSLDNLHSGYVKKNTGISINQNRNKLRSKSKNKRSVSNNKQLIKVTSK